MSRGVLGFFWRGSTVLLKVTRNPVRVPVELKAEGNEEQATQLLEEEHSG